MKPRRLFHWLRLLLPLLMLLAAETAASAPSPVPAGRETPEARVSLVIGIGD